MPFKEPTDKKDQKGSQKIIYHDCNQHNLSIIALNINGLNSPIKISKLLNKFGK